MRCISRFGLLALATTVLTTTPIAVLSPATAQTPTQTRSTTRPDLTLLLQAAEKALNVSAFQTESMTEINGGASGMTAKIQFQTNTLVQAPNRFRSESRFGNESKPRLTIVSDGKTVTIHRADLRQYTTMNYQQFDRRDDTFVVGMSSMLYLMAYPNLKDIIAQGGFSNPAFQKQLTAMLPPEVNRRTETSNGVEQVVYDYLDRQQGFTYAMAINPIDALIKQVRITGNARGMNLVMTETIQSRTPNPKISATTFRFVPPKDAKRVKPISTSPF